MSWTGPGTLFNVPVSPRHLPCLPQFPPPHTVSVPGLVTMLAALLSPRTCVATAAAADPALVIMFIEMTPLDL